MARRASSARASKARSSTLMRCAGTTWDGCPPTSSAHIQWACIDGDTGIDGDTVHGIALMADLRTNLAWFQLPNPVLTASGCAAAGRELNQFFDVAELGAVVTKSIMMQPRSGRPTPRMAETPSGMLNSIGLQGPGIDSFLSNDLRWLTENGVRAAVSIAGSSVEEYGKLAQRLRGHPVTLVEVNISCPNVEDRG